MANNGDTVPINNLKILLSNYICEGIHSYNDCKFKSTRIDTTIYCLIPKGTPYYKNTAHEYVSLKIKRILYLNYAAKLCLIKIKELVLAI